MGQLEVVRKVQGMRDGHVAKPLEEIHRQCVARLPSSADELRQHAASWLVPRLPENGHTAYLYSTSMPVVAKMIPAGSVKTKARAIPKKTVPTLVCFVGKRVSIWVHCSMVVRGITSRYVGTHVSRPSSHSRNPECDRNDV